MTAEQLTDYNRDGYHIERGLLDISELEPFVQRHYEMALQGVQLEGHWHPNPDADDPLERFPRVMYPDKYDDEARAAFIDPRLRPILAQLLGDDPIGTQSMLYFKPPGARGQALHQDNRALQVQPDTCMAAWIAIDETSEENGCLFVAPGTHTMELLCPKRADPTGSSTGHFLDLPEGCHLVPVLLDPGDVLFFNGSLIHGSKANTHTTLWRRAYILHYAPRRTVSTAGHFSPGLDFDGSDVHWQATEGGGPCGGEYLPLAVRDVNG